MSYYISVLYSISDSLLRRLQSDATGDWGNQ